MSASNVAEKADAVKLLQGIGDSGKRAHLREAGAIHRNGFLGEKLNVETGRRIDPDSHGIDPISVDADVGIYHLKHRFLSCVVQQPRQHETVLRHVTQARSRVNELFGRAHTASPLVDLRPPL